MLGTTDTLQHLVQELGLRLSSAADLDLTGHPFAVRHRVASCLQDIAINTCPSALVLLFGSCARGEISEDIDVLVIVESAEQRREYLRLAGLNLSIDLNVASSSWLQSAWRDPEWGYCLSESFVVFSGLPNLEEDWMKSVTGYASLGSRQLRIKNHRDWFDRLSNTANTISPSTENHLVERLLLFEALKVAGNALIEQFGNRVYSHRSFISEVLHAGARAQLPRHLVEAWVHALAGTDDIKSAREQYLAIRRKLSSFFRSEAGSAIGYDAGATRDLRFNSLMLAAVPHRSSVTRFLEESGAAMWLPEIASLHEGHQAVLCAFTVLDSASTQVSILEHGRETVPQYSPIHGARWVEERGTNLKLILNTGGCRTPTCVFCSLPEFGRAQQQSRPSEVIRLATNLYNTRELSLYNDGSLLNPSEVTPSELDEMCLEIRRKNITTLRIESIPRFVTRERVLRVVELSNVRQLTIGMGFQAVGTWPAMSLLGRPDPDALFERAIDVAHTCGIQVRLFLLWDHPSLPLQVWSELLKKSLRWSEQRKVDYVTICPYSPSATSKSTNENSLCCLRSTLSQIRSACVQIDCVVGRLVSCATGMRCLGCSECEGLLRDGTWSTQGSCYRWRRVSRSKKYQQTVSMCDDVQH